MKYLATYDLMETARNTNEWLGATARAVGSYPAFGLTTNPAFQLMAAWGQVTERSFARMTAKPDWDIDAVTGADGRDHVVSVRRELARPFGDLIHFSVSGREPMRRRVLLVAPMSGHYATLLRSTVRSLLPDCEVYVTDWHNARDIPVSQGKFDIEDYTLYVADYIRHLGPDIHVVAVCQPVPLVLAASALLAKDEPAAQPATLTLIGGPVDPDANPTEVTDFGRRVTMGQLERSIIQRVGFNFAGAGRLVYPGLLQLASFMSMNAERHSKAFADQIFRVAKGEAADHDRHNRFYDEYLAVMDMTAEFYLSTVERVFKEREIALNAFSIGGRQLDFGKIEGVAVHIVEGEEDDISAPGQCLAALDLLTGIPEERKAVHLEPGAGHYGIFAGGSWRRNIRPLVLRFIDQHARDISAEPVAPPPAQRPAAPAPASMAQVEAIAEGEVEAGSVPTTKPVAGREPTRATAPERPAKTRATRAAAEAGGAASLVTAARPAKAADTPNEASASAIRAGNGAPAARSGDAVSAQAVDAALKPVEAKVHEASPIEVKPSELLPEAQAEKIAAAEPQPAPAPMGKAGAKGGKAEASAKTGEAKPISAQAATGNPAPESTSQSKAGSSSALGSDSPKKTSPDAKPATSRAPEARGNGAKSAGPDGEAAQPVGDEAKTNSGARSPEGTKASGGRPKDGPLPV